MAYDSTGNFIAVVAPAFPAVDGTTIVASYYNSVITDLISGLNLAMCRDGRSVATGNFNLGTYKLTNLGNGVAPGDSITFGQVAALLANLAVSTSATLPAATTIGTVSAAELAYMSGVTSGVQTQLNAKAPIASPILTGVPRAPTAAVGTSSTQIATMEAIANQVMIASFPGLAGNAGKFASNDGVNVIWADLAVNGGASETSPMTTDLTLTSSSHRVQAVTPTVAGLKIQLPDATTLTASLGAPVFVIPNLGTVSVRVVDAAGNTKAIVGVQQTAAFSLSNGGTVAGTWQALNQTYDASSLPLMYAGTAVAISANALVNSDRRIACTSLDASRFVVAWSDQTATLGRAAVVDVSGAIPSVGTATSFLTTNAPTQVTVCTLSSTQVLVCFSDGAGIAKVLTIAGSAITAVGAPYTYNGGGLAGNHVRPLSSSYTLVVYNDGSNNLSAKCLSISGTTVSGGSAAAIQVATVTDYQKVTILSATKAICTYQLSSSTYLRAVVLDVSGTVVTAGGDVALNAVASTHIAAASLQDGSRFAVIFSNAAANLQAFIASVSGTSFTLGATATIRSGSCLYTTAATYSSRKIALSYIAPTTAYTESIVLTVDFDNLSYKSSGPVVSSAASGAYTNCACTADGKLLTSWRNSGTTYGNISVVEILG